MRKRLGRIERYENSRPRPQNYKFKQKHLWLYLGVSKNSGTPKSSILIGFSITNHPFWVPPFSETPTWRMGIIPGLVIVSSYIKHNPHMKKSHEKVIWKGNNPQLWSSYQLLLLFFYLGYSDIPSKIPVLKHTPNKFSQR